MRGRKLWIPIRVSFCSNVCLAVSIFLQVLPLLTQNYFYTLYVTEARPRTAQEVRNIWLGQVPEENYSADAVMKVAFGERLPANAHEIRPLLSRWLERWRAEQLRWLSTNESLARLETNEVALRRGISVRRMARQKTNYDCLTGLLFALDRFKQEGKIDARHWDALEDDALVKGPVELEAAIRRLKDLARFRAAIGYFPGEYVPNDEPAKSEQRAAFVRAGSEHCKKRGLPADTNLAVGAWETHHKIKSGTFRAAEALQ